MTGAAAHAFLEPYIGVSSAKVTNKLHSATLPTLPRSISSTPTLHSIRSRASSHPLQRFIPSASALHPIRSRASSHPLQRFIPSAPALHSIRSHALFLPTIRTFSSTPTPYSPQLAHPRHHSHVSSLAHPGSPSRTPTYSHPLLQVDAPSLIPTQALTSTNISTELCAPTSPSPRTPPPTYTHLSPLLYVDARPLVRTSSPTYTYLFDKSFKRFI